MKSLDSDFSKAKVILEKYKSTESLARNNSTENLKKQKSMSVQNLLTVPSTKENTFGNENEADRPTLENGQVKKSLTKQGAVVPRQKKTDLEEWEEAEKERRRRSWTYL